MLETDNSKRQIIVRENKLPLVLAWFVIVFDILVLLLVVWSDFRGNKTVGAGYVMCAAFFVAAVLLMMDYYVRRLTIGDYECVYRSIFGLKRRFSVMEIGQIRVTTGSEVIRLCDQDGKLLARFENNMTGAGEALSYLRGRGIPTYTKEGMLLKMAAEEARDEQEEREEPEESPCFYQSAGWVKAIRILLWVVNLGGLILAVASLRYLSFYFTCLIYIFVPLADYILFLCFNRVIISEEPKKADKQWKDTHVSFPWFPFALLMLILLYNYSLINIRSSWAYWCIPIVGSLLILPVWLVVHRRHRFGKLSLLLLCIAMYYAVFAEVPYVNWVCRTAPPEHVYAVVTEKEADSGSRSVTRYYIGVKMTDGSSARLCVSSALYGRVQQYSYVIVCKRKSVFGVEYWIVHL